MSRVRSNKIDPKTPCGIIVDWLFASAERSAAALKFSPPLAKENPAVKSKHTATCPKCHEGVNRREFVGQSLGLLTAATALPAVLPSLLVGCELGNDYRFLADSV